MTKWLERTKPLVPACLLFGSVMIYQRFWPGPWLLMAGLLWFWFALDDERRTLAALTAQQAKPTSREAVQRTDAASRKNAFAWGLYAVAAVALFGLNWLGGDVTIRWVVAQAAVVGLMTLAILVHDRAGHRASV